VSSPLAKNILLVPSGKSEALSRAVLSHQEGRTRDRHGRWVQDAVDALNREASDTMRTAKSCGPDTPTLVSSLRVIPQATVAIKPGTPGRARNKP
jgi:hypothetical protein